MVIKASKEKLYGLIGIQTQDFSITSPLPYFYTMEAKIPSMSKSIIITYLSIIVTKISPSLPQLEQTLYFLTLR